MIQTNWSCREHDEVSEARSDVFWSPENEEEGMFWRWDSDDDKVDEIAIFDSICCSSLRGFLLDGRKKRLYSPKFVRMHFKRL